MCKLAGPQHKENGDVISTENARWRGPNIENFEKKIYKQSTVAGAPHREFRKENPPVKQVG
ncbi:hypothetical protein FE70_09870, partial [Staphylococcus aureus]|uniref:hypothetical protein n=1 Tax=Staphylococcus aureus TaxID=1280 RepID=UPI00065B6E8A